MKLHDAFPAIYRLQTILALMALGACLCQAQEPSATLGIFTSHSDIGLTPAKGSASFDTASSQYRISGGGANMWSGADAFHFAWRQVSGDFVLTANVQFVGKGAVDHRKAALLVRQSLDPQSVYADVALHGDGLTALQFRTAPGAETAEVRSPSTAPVRLRLERHGAQVTAYAAALGANPAEFGLVTLDLKGPLYVGLGVCSHDAHVLETAIFSDVSLQELPARDPELNPAKVRSTISVYDLASKTVSAVYSADALWEAPNWSPDGKYLMSNSGGDLYRFSMDTASPQPEKISLEPGYKANNDHGLSPDGKHLAISAEHGGARASQVYVAGADGNQPKLITPNMPSYFHGWSPDGQWLAFVAERDGNFDIYRIPSSGSPEAKEERLTSDPGFDDGPDYSPDGKWIYINSNRGGGGWNVWRFPADGAGPSDSKAEQITNDAQEDWFPHPSPDGKWIVMLSFPPGTPGHDTKTSVHLRILPASQGPVHPSGTTEDWSDSIHILTEFFGGQGTINVNSWSPDSRKFAFVSYQMLPQ